MSNDPADNFQRVGVDYHVCRYCQRPVPFGTRSHDGCRIGALEDEAAALRRLTVALGRAVQPFIKNVPDDKWKAVIDAYAACPEAPYDPSQTS